MYLFIIDETADDRNRQYSPIETDLRGLDEADVTRF